MLLSRETAVSAVSRHGHPGVLRTLTALVLVVPLGFASKLYSGPARGWVNDSLSGVFFEVFWCILGSLAFRRARASTIAVVVCLLSSALEFSQLWHPRFLQMARRSFIGLTLLGDTFVPSDFVYYALGCAAGWGLLRLLSRPREGGELFGHENLDRRGRA